MHTLFLYAGVVLIWGTTWAAIPYQLGEVAVPVSVGYRFVLAAISLYLYAWLTRRRFRVPRDAMPMILLQGILLFFINYLLIYHAAAYITSGLIAVLFTLIVLLNAVFSRLFFGTRLDARLLAAGVVGTAGIALMFLPELDVPGSREDILLGIALVVGGTISASLGNMTAVVNTSRNLPVVAVNAHGMLLGGILSIAVSLVLDEPLNFSFDPGYVISLLYLAIFGSAIAFGAYIALLRRIGASRAAYSSVLFPVVALLTSTVLEDYRWSIPAAVGILLALVGNWLALGQANKKKQGEN